MGPITPEATFDQFRTTWVFQVMNLCGAPRKEVEAASRAIEDRAAVLSLQCKLDKSRIAARCYMLARDLIAHGYTLIQALSRMPNNPLELSGIALPGDNDEKPTISAAEIALQGIHARR